MSQKLIKIPKIHINPKTGKKYILVNKQRVYINAKFTKKEIAGIYKLLIKNIKAKNINQSKSSAVVNINNVPPKIQRRKRGPNKPKPIIDPNNKVIVNSISGQDRANEDKINSTNNNLTKVNQDIERLNQLLLTQQNQIPQNQIQQNQIPQNPQLDYDKIPEIERIIQLQQKPEFKKFLDPTLNPYLARKELKKLMNLSNLGHRYDQYTRGYDQLFQEHQQHQQQLHSERQQQQSQEQEQSHPIGYPFESPSGRPDYGTDEQFAERFGIPKGEIDYLFRSKISPRFQNNDALVQEYGSPKEPEAPDEDAFTAEDLAHLDNIREEHKRPPEEYKRPPKIEQESLSGDDIQDPKTIGEEYNQLNKMFPNIDNPLDYQNYDFIMRKKMTKLLRMDLMHMNKLPIKPTDTQKFKDNFEKEMSRVSPERIQNAYDEIMKQEQRKTKGLKKFVEHVQSAGKRYIEGGLYNDEIDKIMSHYKDYLGTIMRDGIKYILPYVTKHSRVAFIINTDRSNQPGRHWCAVYIDGRSGPESSNSLEWYNSFGDKMPQDILDDCKLIVKIIKPESVFLKLKQNNVVQQNSNSQNCGFFCIRFLIDKFRGKSFSQCTGFDQDSKIHDSTRNEKEIEKIKSSAPFNYI